MPPKWERGYYEKWWFVKSGFSLEGEALFQGVPPQTPRSLWLHRLWRWHASLAACGLADFAGQNLGGSAKPIISAHRKALAGRQAYARLRPQLRLHFASLCASCSLRSGAPAPRPDAEGRWAHTIGFADAATPAVAQPRRRVPTKPVRVNSPKGKRGCQPRKQFDPSRTR